MEITNKTFRNILLVRTSFFTVVPPFVISYLIYDAAEKEHERLMRKQPGQFDHES